MKIARSLALVMVAALAVPLAAQQANPVAGALRDILKERGKHLVGAAQEMPPDKYGFHPTPPQMTFGHLVLHTAGSNFFLCSKIGETAPPSLPELKDTDSKDKLVERLKASFDFCSQTLAKLDDSKLAGEVTVWGGHKMSRAEAMFELSNDWADHYSAAAVYLRLNGLLPPTAKKP